MFGNYRVNRAIEAIGKDSVCVLPTKLKTFDVASICAHGLNGTTYDELKSSARSWLTKWRYHWGRRLDLTLDEYRRSTTKIYHATTTPADVVDSIMIVVAHSIGVGEPTQADEIVHRRVVKARQTPLRVWKTSLTATPTDQGRWMARTPHGKDIECIPLPIDDPTVPSEYQSMALFLAEPIPEDYAVELERVAEIWDAFADIREGKVDFISHSHTASNSPIEICTLVLFVRSDWEIFDVSTTAEDARITELDSADLRHVCVPRPNMTPYGWRAKNLAPKTVFEVKFRARKRKAITEVRE